MEIAGDHERRSHIAEGERRREQNRRQDSAECDVAGFHCIALDVWGLRVETGCESKR